MVRHSKVYFLLLSFLAVAAIVAGCTEAPIAQTPPIPATTPSPTSTTTTTPASTPLPVPPTTSTTLPTPAPTSESLILQVGGSGQYQSIQKAIDSAKPGATIQVAQGTYMENITINSPKNIRLQGGWKTDFTSQSNDNTSTVIDGGARGNVLVIGISNGVNVTFMVEDLTILNGVAENGGGIRAVASGSGSSIKLEISNTTITRNTANNTGGGVDIVSTDGSSIMVNLNNSTISGNKAGNIAGGIHTNSVRGSKLEATFSKNIVKGNLSPNNDAGGIGAYTGILSKTGLTITNNVIVGNEALFGGGILGYAHSGGVATIIMNNNLIAGNKAQYGSAIFTLSGVSGAQTQPGGKISWEITNNTITGNVATRGDGIHLHSGSAEGDGGDIDFSMKNDIVWGNTDPNRGLQVNIVVEPGRVGSAVVKASYSNIGSMATWGTGTYTTDHVTNNDPLFIDPVNESFRLQEKSPCIDAGDPSQAFNDGQRPPAKGAERNDIGAYGGPKNYDWPEQTNVRTYG